MPAVEKARYANVAGDGAGVGVQAAFRVARDFETRRRGHRQRCARALAEAPNKRSSAMPWNASNRRGPGRPTFPASPPEAILQRSSPSPVWRGTGNAVSERTREFESPRPRLVRRNKGEERAIARDRVARLVELAEEALRAGRDERAHRYAELAWRVKTTYQLRGTAIDGRACRACHAFLQPGRTSRVRLTGGRRTATCLRCGAMRRTPLTAARRPAVARSAPDAGGPPPTRRPAP